MTPLNPDPATQFTRTLQLLGNQALKNLTISRVALFGIGGVGSYVAEILVRAGVGKMLLVDGDTVTITNLNRQLCALYSTLGKYKCEVMADRLLDINPAADIQSVCNFYLPENSDDFDLSAFDYIIDAVDTVRAKVALALQAQAANVPLLSCMGTGNKFDPSAFKIADIYATKICPLCKVMRRELKKCGVETLEVVYSEELPSSNLTPPGTLAFVPAAAALLMASRVIMRLANQEKKPDYT